MAIRSKLSLGPVGIAASATLVIGALSALPIQSAFADSHPAPSASVLNGILTIEGTNGPDAITVGVAADPSRLQVAFGEAAAAQSFDRATFTAISVALRSGDDTFSVDPHAQFSDRPLTVYGGRGDDTIRGSDGNDVLFGGRGDDNIDGARGADTEILGRGNDTALWLPGEGSDTIDGGRGSDLLTFVGNGLNEKFALAANGSHAILTRDLGTIVMDTDRVESVDLAALGGADTVNVGDLAGTHLRADNIDLSSAGAADGQLDVVSVDGTDDADHVAVDAGGSTVQVDGLHTRTTISGSDTRDQLHVNTGAGDDSVAVSDAAAAAIAVTVDLGADQN